MAGPGVKSLGLTDAVWSDHVDVRPTILALAGVTGDYVHDGRALIEFMRPGRLSSQAAANADQLTHLGAAYKEITAPFHELGLGVLNVSTRALKGGTRTMRSLNSGSPR
jgi:arylsulfatase A-like enzyme